MRKIKVKVINKPHIFPDGLQLLFLFEKWINTNKTEMEMKTKNVPDYKRIEKTITFDISSIEKKIERHDTKNRPSEDINDEMDTQTRYSKFIDWICLQGVRHRLAIMYIFW